MRTAVVIGAGIAGLLAARVLTEHADEVVIVERDRLDDSPAQSDSGDEPRRGVPQGTQMHALLEAGRRGVERWLPGFTDDFVAAGAVRANSGRDVHAHLDGRLKVLVGDLPMISATRPFLENHIRRRVLACAPITVRTGVVRGLSFAGDRVDGVRITPTGAVSDTRPETLSADLVVDATGRGSRITSWLTEAGWPEPPMRRIPVDLGYATAFLRTPDVTAAGGAMVAQSLTTLPDGRVRLATLGRVEGDRWIVLLAGYAQDHPGRTPGEFLDRCRTDPAPVFGKLAANAELVGEVAMYRHPDNRRRDFHTLRRFPAGLVCVGDAVASFNPVYGQGMSSAAQHAAALATALESGSLPGQPAHAYFKAVRRTVDDAWQTSVLNDLRLPHLRGEPRPPGFRLAAGLGDMVLRATVTDPVVGRRFLDVMHMLAGPVTLMRPGTLLRAARASRRA
ncbi:MAG TPA: FAD-dependent monooxygenase [Yinghuangia sp.]|nr:FAD-dependent monooxygenase [Yinghuangia sp.]